MKAALLRRVLAAQAGKRPVAVVTELASGRQALLERDTSEGELTVGAEAIGQVRRLIADDKSATIETPAGRLFVEVWNPPLRLLVVGAAHIAQPLTRMAALAGYAVSVVDPRSAFATAERFPGIELSTEWPDEAFARLNPDHRSAVVTLTHDPKIDDPALISALRSDAFYIGALGSRRTHAVRLGRLREAGFGEAELQRVRGPVGLDIGAVSPAEIAVSILAEVTQTLRREPA